MENKFKRQYETNMLRYGNPYGPVPKPAVPTPVVEVSSTPDVAATPRVPLPVQPPADVYENALLADGSKPVPTPAPGGSGGSLGLAPKAAKAAYNLLTSSPAAVGPAEAAYAAGSGPAALPGGQFFGGATLPGSSGGVDAGMFSSVMPSLGMAGAMAGAGLMAFASGPITQGFHKLFGGSESVPGPSYIDRANAWARGEPTATADNITLPAIRSAADVHMQNALKSLYPVSRDNYVGPTEEQASALRRFRKLSDATVKKIINKNKGFNKNALLELVRS